MADYKHRAMPKKKKNNDSNSGSLWFFGGFITGAFVMGLVWLKLGPELSSGTVPGLSQSRPQPAPARESQIPKPRFDFYTILPEMEVVIPDEELAAPEPAEKQDPTTPAATKTLKTEPGTAYILQMGSFRKHADADRMKARLALIGIEAEIQKVSINNNDTYHRVRSGPYSSQERLNTARRLARENNISTLVIKLKN
jgi:cell division protein FtsN